ncbi:hypothetical protein E5F92_000480 [Flavobacterium columnare]|uniref:hypothetical protein n=1 Tax=Flavobacterium columnare TaxID=996 RepID=UPI002989B680|nr:hypothetical protein [Flavobacterium columnare]MCH4831233.1 hypothetical protein [Flavobacterium columnare]
MPNGKVVVKEVLVNSEGKNHLKKPKVKIEDNKLSVDCEARAQELFAKWKSEQKTEVHETVRNIYHEVEKSLTWWQLFQIWCGRLLLIVIMLFLIIKYLVKSINLFNSWKTTFLRQTQNWTAIMKLRTVFLFIRIMQQNTRPNP